MRGKFSFLYVDIWFDVTKCKFFCGKQQFEILIVFSPIFVDTEIIFVYNFVAPLKFNISSYQNICFGKTHVPLIIVIRNGKKFFPFLMTMNQLKRM